MSGLTARPKTADDDEWIIAIRNRINDHLPPTSIASFRHWERVDRVSEKAHVERYVIERGEERVGSFFLEKMWWTEKEGGYFAGISVDPRMWGQGIGAWMFDALMGRLSELKAERVYGSVRNDRPDAQGFVDRRG